MIKLFNKQHKGELAKKAILSGLIVLLVLAAFCYGKLLTRPFPFLNIDYISQYEWDHDQSQLKEYKNFPISAELARWIENEKLKSTEQKITVAVNFARNLSRASSSKRIRVQNQILDNSPEFNSICSETSKIFTTLMNLFGVPSRVVWMNGHTVSEIFDRKWILIDSFGNVRGYDSAGTPLSLREIVTNYEGVSFEKVLDDESELPGNFINTGYLKTPTNIYAHQNLLLIISPKDLYQFHLNTRDPLLIFMSITGIDENAVGHGKQLVINNYRVGNFGIRYKYTLGIWVSKLIKNAWDYAAK